MVTKRRYYLQRYGAIGDVLMAEPLLRELTSRGAHVTFVTRPLCARVLENFPSENLTISFNRNQFLRGLRKVTGQIKKLKYERFPEMPVQEAYARIAGVDDFVPSVPRLHLTEEEKRQVLPTPYAVVHLEQHLLMNHRRVFGVDWGQVASFLRHRGFNVYQVGLSAETECGEHIETRDIRELARVTHGASLFIGVDSAPSHFAISMRKKSVVFFGSVDPRLRHADLRGVEVVQGPCDQAGCYHHLTTRSGKAPIECVKVGPDGEPPCCKHSASDVIERIERLIDSPDPESSGRHVADGPSKKVPADS